MTYERFEDTPVWNAAQELGVDVFALLEDAAFDEKGDLRDQLQRAVLSISNNIAEGFERGTTEDLLWFLYIARGSAGEVRNALLFAQRLADRGILKSQTSNLKSQISICSPDANLSPANSAAGPTTSRTPTSAASATSTTPPASRGSRAAGPKSSSKS